MIRIMLVDDHKMVREGLKRLIELNDDMTVVAEADDGNECMAKVRAAKPDLVILDISMPEMDGMEMLAALKKRKNSPGVLVLTAHKEADFLKRAVDLGVSGYILKDLDSDELFHAIRCIVYEGEQYIQSELIPVLNAKIVALELDQDKMKLLSDRELEVLKLIAEGCLNKDIGEILSISERTVKNHVFNIFRKIECTDRTQAAIFCFRTGLVNVRD